MGNVFAFFGNDTHTWKNLDKTDKDGKDYIYSIDEIDVPENYTKKIINNTTIENTYRKKPGLPNTGEQNNIIIPTSLSIGGLLIIAYALNDHSKKRKDSSK